MILMCQEVYNVMVNECTSGKCFVSKPGIFSLTTMPGDCSLFVSKGRKVEDAGPLLLRVVHLAKWLKRGNIWKRGLDIMKNPG
jgi:hypothetical protein